jgi:hypothetical protein
MQICFDYTGRPHGVTTAMQTEDQRELFFCVTEAYNTNSALYLTINLLSLGLFNDVMLSEIQSSLWREGARFKLRLHKCFTTALNSGTIMKVRSVI